MALNIYVYILLIFFIVQILCLRDETLIKYLKKSIEWYTTMEKLSHISILRVPS
jgi:hypothetical protein